MTPIQKTSDEDIAAMRVDAAAGMSSNDIATKFAKNITTVRKYCRGYHKDQPTESVQQPQPAEPQMLYPGQIQPPSRRPETKTDLTPAADTATDAARLLHSVDYISRMVKGNPTEEYRTISEMIQGQTDPLQEALAKKDEEIAQLRQQIGADRIGSLKDYIDRALAMQKEHSESQHQIAEQRLAYELALAKKSEYKEKVEASLEMYEKIPDIIAKSVASTLTSLQASGLPPGMLLGRARSYGDALVDSMHPVVGGMIAETPIDVSEVRHRARRTMVAAPRPAPYQRSDEELEDDIGDFVEAVGMDRDEMERDIHDETDHDKRRDFLAGELAKSRAKIAELEEQQRHGGPRPEPTPQTPQIRRVIAAAPAVKKSAEGSP